MTHEVIHQDLDFGTVKELIQKLQNFRPDAVVNVRGEATGNTYEIESISLLDGTVYLFFID